MDFQWNSTADDDQVLSTEKMILDKAAELAKSRGLLHRYIYQNYAYITQDVFEGYGPESMAKLQKATLDPTKISGRCGRLKCCLRFEQDVYEEFLKELPPINARVVTAKGPGRVLAHEVLARRVLIEFEDGRRLPVPVDEVLSRL